MVDESVDDSVEQGGNIRFPSRWCGHRNSRILMPSSNELKNSSNEQ